MHTNLSHAKTIDAGSGYLCQMEPVAHYGLRQGEVIKNISIKWTNGSIDSYDINDINKTLEFKQEYNFNVYSETLKKPAPRFHWKCKHTWRRSAKTHCGVYLDVQLVILEQFCIFN